MKSHKTTRNYTEQYLSTIFTLLRSGTVDWKKEEKLSFWMCELYNNLIQIELYHNQET